jgi:hypothetical protein
MSPAFALDLARVEARCGVRSTYTVLLSGEYYNPFEPEVRKILREIAGLGHEIGLHFDPEAYEIASDDDLDTAIAWEASVLSGLLGADAQVRMFSFHNPTQEALACDKVAYGGLWNAYAAMLREQVSYLSDSNGHWRYRSWDQALAERPPRFQILTHPEWWMAEDRPPAEKVVGHIEERSRKVWSRYCEVLRSGGRENRSFVPQAMKALPELIGQEGEDLLRLWLSGRRRAAFVELSGYVAVRCRHLAVSVIPSPAVGTILIDRDMRLDPLLFLAMAFQVPLTEITGLSDDEYRNLMRLCGELDAYDDCDLPFETLRGAFDRLSGMLAALENWGATGHTVPREFPSGIEDLHDWIGAHLDALGISRDAWLACVARQVEASILETGKEYSP